MINFPLRGWFDPYRFNERERATRFSETPEGGLDLVTSRQDASNRRLQSPPGRTRSLARGSYNSRKRPLRRSRCEHGFFSEPPPEGGLDLATNRKGAIYPALAATSVS